MRHHRLRDRHRRRLKAPLQNEAWLQIMVKKPTQMMKPATVRLAFA